MEKGHSAENAVETSRKPLEQPGTASSNTRKGESPDRRKIGKEHSSSGFRLRRESCCPDVGSREGEKPSALEHGLEKGQEGVSLMEPDYREEE